MEPTQLRAVSDTEQAGSVDSWTLPEDLPADVAIFPRRFMGERLWKFNSENILLMPMPAQKVEDTLSDYLDYSVLTHNHRKWFLKNQKEAQELCKAHAIYFLSDVYIRHDPTKPPEATRFIYRITCKDGKCIEEEVRLESIPPKGTGRIILMR